MIGEIVNIQRGFFFIANEEGQEYFAHKSGLLDQSWIYYIRIGDRVWFTPTEGKKGPMAIDISIRPREDDPPLAPNFDHEQPEEDPTAKKLGIRSRS